MKKFILPICFALSLAACSDKKDETKEVTRQIVLTDTANLSSSNINTDVAAEAPLAVTAPRPTVVYVDRYVKPAPTPRVRATTPKPTPVQEQPEEVSNPNVGTSTPAIPDVVASVPEPVVNKKKGISDAGKGAVIGAVGGAVAGAVIGRNGKGAAIGAVIGAAGGYVIGRKKDKQSGRIE